MAYDYFLLTSKYQWLIYFMNRYLPAFESLGFLFKQSKSNLGKSSTPVSTSFILVTSILFKSLAKPRFDNLIQFVNFSFFLSFHLVTKLQALLRNISIMPKERRYRDFKLMGEYLISPYFLSMA